MGILGRILGSDEAITKGIDVVAKGLDSLFYTEEEKATDIAKQKAIAGGMLIDWMAASQGQRLARRVIAISITAVWLLMYVTSALLSVIAVWVSNAAQFKASANILNDSADSMQGAVMLILGFYFAAPYLGDIVKPAMAKFATKKSGD